MARASTHTRIPAAYRQPLLGKPDPRLTRCLAISSILGAIVVFGVLVAPVRQVEIRMDEIPRRLAKLILEPPKPAVLPPQIEARPAPTESASTQFEPVPAPGAAEPVQTQAEATPRSEPSRPRGQRRGEIERRVDSGNAGREQARREVRESLRQTQQEVKQTLAEVTAVLSAVKSESPSSSAPRRGRPGGGRTRAELAQIDAVPAAGEGTGAGGPITAGLLDIGSITDVRSDLASADPSVGAAGREGGGAEGSSGSADPGAYRSNASLLAVVRRYAPGIQYCYDNELKRDLGLNGKMVLVLTVLASGVVSEVTLVQDTVGSPRLEECVLAQVREWRFPAISEGTVTFRTPFMFTPPES